MKNILIVDDDPDFSHMLKTVLDYSGYQVMVSHNPNDGIDMAQKHKPDLILMDMVLPGINGSEAVGILKSNTETKEIPILFLTGLLSDENPNKYEIMIDNCACGVVAKPFHIKELLNRIKTVIG